jgi:hypothetical protein
VPLLDQRDQLKENTMEHFGDAAALVGVAVAMLVLAAADWIEERIALAHAQRNQS